MRVVRFSKPTHLVKYPFGTVIEVPVEDSPVIFYYIQASQVQDDPQWIDLGQLLVSRLRHDFDKLIDKVIECLKNNSELNLT
jgi:hypothetical protein